MKSLRLYVSIQRRSCHFMMTFMNHWQRQKQTCLYLSTDSFSKRSAVVSLCLCDGSCGAGSAPLLLRSALACSDTTWSHSPVTGNRPVDYSIGRVVCPLLLQPGRWDEQVRQHHTAPAAEPSRRFRREHHC